MLTIVLRLAVEILEEL